MLVWSTRDGGDNGGSIVEEDEDGSAFEIEFDIDASELEADGYPSKAYLLEVIGDLLDTVDEQAGQIGELDYKIRLWSVGYSGEGEGVFN